MVEKNLIPTKSNELKLAINVSKPLPTLKVRSSISLITPIDVHVLHNLSEEEKKTELDKKDELDAVHQKAKLPLP